MNYCRVAKNKLRNSEKWKNGGAGTIRLRLFCMLRPASHAKPRNYCGTRERPVLSSIMKRMTYSLSAEAKEAVADRIDVYLSGLKGVAFAYLHGSFLEDSFRDVDVAVYLRDPPTPPLASELELETELGRLARYP